MVETEYLWTKTLIVLNKVFNIDLYVGSTNLSGLGLCPCCWYSKYYCMYVYYQ